MKQKLFKTYKILTVVIAITATVASLSFAISRAQDMTHLRNLVLSEITLPPGNGKFIEQLNQWVYHNKGFEKNQSYYLFSRLGPTPMQILDKGGDCSDKSRLLAAMLKSVGISSTLVMLYRCNGCDPTHTVIEARFEGNYMVADPVYNIVFPKEENATYLGLQELSDNPKILNNRLDYLIEQRGKKNKISFYKRDIETYSWPKTINWKKNSVTLIIGEFVGYFYDNPYWVQRPHFLEDPKLLLTIASACICGGVLILFGFIRLITKYKAYNS